MRVYSCVHFVVKQGREVHFRGTETRKKRCRIPLLSCSISVAGLCYLAVFFTTCSWSLLLAVLLCFGVLCGLFGLFGFFLGLLFVFCRASRRNQSCGCREKSRCRERSRSNDLRTGPRTLMAHLERQGEPPLQAQCKRAE